MVSVEGCPSFPGLNQVQGEKEVHRQVGDRGRQSTFLLRKGDVSGR